MHSFTVANDLHRSIRGRSLDELRFGFVEECVMSKTKYASRWKELVILILILTFWMAIKMVLQQNGITRSDLGADKLNWAVD